MLTADMIDAAEDAGVVFGANRPADDPNTPEDELAVILRGEYGGVFINNSGGVASCDPADLNNPCAQSGDERITLEGVDVADGACDSDPAVLSWVGGPGRAAAEARAEARAQAQQWADARDRFVAALNADNRRPSQPDYSAFWWTFINDRNVGLLGSAVDRWISDNWLGTPLPGDPGTAQGRQQLRDELDAVAVAEGGIDLSALNAADVSLDVSYIKATTLDDYPRRHDRPVVVSPSDGSSIRITGDIQAPPDKPLLIVSGCHIIIDGPCVFGAVNPADPGQCPTGL